VPLTVADAIVATDDLGAIAMLLGNSSAQISEEALETIIETAPEVESWHLPLVKRQNLPLRAAFRLAHFVAANLVEMLQSHGDLSENEVSEIREIVEKRINDSTVDPDWANAERGKKQTPTTSMICGMENRVRRKKGSLLLPFKSSGI